MDDYKENHSFQRLEPYVDERYKEFCRNQGKAEDVSIYSFFNFLEK